MRVDHAAAIEHDLVPIVCVGETEEERDRGETMAVLERQIGDGTLDRINLYFPDPWPKKRHHKRRIIQPSFLALCRRMLTGEGHLHVATDWANYAEHIDEVVEASGDFSVVERRQHGGENALERPNTKFERRGEALGHDVFDLEYVRLETSAGELRPT